MIMPVSDINFEGHSPKIKLRRRQIKNLSEKEGRLAEKCKLLQNNLNVLSGAWQKITTLPPDIPPAGKLSALWKLKFDLQYSFINGSYGEYKNARKAYAKAAVSDYPLVRYVNNPITMPQTTPLFSKTGMNMFKNCLLDKFRIKTPEERKLVELSRAGYKDRTMAAILTDGAR